MNASKALEIAIAQTIRQHAELGSGTLVRPWQSLKEDGAFDPESDRTFPCVDIRFAAPRYNQDQHTIVCSGQILVMTYTEDDKDHEKISIIFGEMHNVLLSIFRDSMGESNTGYYAEMVAYVAEQYPDAMHIGGVTLTDGTPPIDQQGLNAIGVGFDVHFSYKR
jgi:hypothetical protein